MKTRIHKEGKCQLSPTSVSLVKVSDSTYIYEIDINREFQIEGTFGTGNDEEQGVSILSAHYDPDIHNYEPCEISFIAESDEEKKIIGGLHYVQRNKNSIMGTFIIADHIEDHECILSWSEKENTEDVVI
jgi:hypothetical protein